MSRQSSSRRLAAILSADVVGYSRLISDDEEGTRRQFNACFDRALSPSIGRFHGRVVKTMGDDVLVEFSSAVDAVRCAVELQTELAAMNAELKAERRMLFRVGVNLGDVLVEGGDIRGDGVNVAARLEALAAPGEILISGLVCEIVRSKVNCGFEDLGRREVKNIVGGVHAFKVLLEAGDGDSHGDSMDPRLSEADDGDTLPSIIVLPFSTAATTKSKSILPMASPGT